MAAEAAVQSTDGVDGAVDGPAEIDKDAPTHELCRLQYSYGVIDVTPAGAVKLTVASASTEALKNCMKMMRPSWSSTHTDEM